MASQNLNRWVGTGNLTRDPEIKATGGGLQIAELRVAVNARVKRGDEWVDKANYFDVVVFGAKTESIGRYLHKGSAVAIDGRLDYQEWEHKEDGTKRNRVLIIADTVQFTDGAPRDGAPPPEEEFTPAPTGGAASDDDIPF